MKMQISVTFVKKKKKNHFFKHKKYDKIRDHCHYTGKYRSALHII